MNFPIKKTSSFTSEEHKPFVGPFLSGAIAHFTETICLGQIFERIKVEQEKSPHLKKISAAVKVIAKTEGVAGFYKGGWAYVFLNTIKGGIGWQIFRESEKIAHGFSTDHTGTFSPLRLLATAVLTSLIETSLFIQPLERLKTLRMTESLTEYLALKNIIKKQGVSFFFHGWKFVVLRQSVNWTAYLFSYHFFRKELLYYRKKEEIVFYEKFLLGGSCGVIASLVCTPFDFVRTHIQKAGSTLPTDIIKSIDQLQKTYGYSRFFVGLKIKLLRNALSAGVTFLVLDKLHALPNSLKL